MISPKNALISVAASAVAVLAMAVPASAASAASAECSTSACNPPPPPNCTAARDAGLVNGLLVNAQITVRTDAKALRTDNEAREDARKALTAAQSKDTAALKIRDAAIAAAQATYQARTHPAVTPVVATGVTVPALPADTYAARLAAAQTAANAEATAAAQKTADGKIDSTALGVRNTAIANANSEYQAGGTAAALASAKEAARKANERCNRDQADLTAATNLVITLTGDRDRCHVPPPPTTPAPPTSTTDVPPPPPVVVPGPTTVIQSPPQTIFVPSPGAQIGPSAPSGSVSTGAINPADRYLG